jgi:periplasmic protein TonB
MLPRKVGLFVLLLLPIACKQTQVPTSPHRQVAPTAGMNSANQKGTLLVKVEPKYPPVAQAARIQGAVVLHAIIAADGTVESLEAVSGPPILYGAAINAVKQWVYKPYVMDGVARRVDTRVTVNFELKQPQQ